jgi:hypothetical protein
VPYPMDTSSFLHSVALNQFHRRMASLLARPTPDRRDATAAVGIHLIFPSSFHALFSFKLICKKAEKIKHGEKQDSLGRWEARWKRLM